MKRTEFLLIPVVLVLFSCAQGKSPEEQKAEIRAIPVKAVHIYTTDFVEYGEYYGTVSGIREAELVSVAGGTVESIDIREGSMVSAGQSIAKIDSKKIINQYETAILNARIAYDNYQRQEKFLSSGNTSQVAVDQAQLAYLNSQTNLMDAERARRGALCISPIDGIVMSRFIELYQELAPGTTTFIVADLSQVKITVGIPESDINGLRENSNAEVTFSNFPGRVWNGTLVSFSRKSSSRDLSFQAEIHIDNPDGLVMSGITANVRLTLGTLYDVVVIPTSSIITIGEHSFVMLAEDNKAVQQRIVMGPSNETHTVIASGLAAEDMLITEGIHIVSDGSPINISG